MSTLPRICKREDGDAKLAYCSQKTAEFVGCGEDSENSILEDLEADCRIAPASTSQCSATTRQRTTNVVDDTLPSPSKTKLRSQSSDITTLNDLTMRNDENFRSPLINNAAVEHSVVECEIPEGYLIPCRQIKVEPDDSFYESEEESQTDGKWPHLTFKEATTVKSELTDDAASRCGAAPERNIKNHAVADGSEGTAIANCSVVLHPLDTSLLKTLQSPYDAVALADKLKAQTQNCNRCKYPHQRAFQKKLKTTGERGKMPKRSSGGKKLCECSYCGKTFSQISNLKSHAVVHTGERPFQCSYCDEKFHLNHHKKRHERRHRCSYCDEEFHDVAQKTLHEKKHTAETPYQCHQCLYCEKKFRQSYLKTRHERTHTGERPYQCSYCDKKFYVNSVKKRHETRTHTPAAKKPHQCFCCDKAFHDVTQKTLHERTHTAEMPYQCSYCEKKFRQGYLKTRHERRMHDGERPYQCSYCDKKFHVNSEKKRHETRMHTTPAAKKPHRCSYCDKAFYDVWHKTLHERTTHNGEKAFQCCYCDKKFSLNHHKRRHERSYCKKAVSMFVL